MWESKKLEKKRNERERERERERVDPKRFQLHWQGVCVNSDAHTWSCQDLKLRTLCVCVQRNDIARKNHEWFQNNY
jgi:hypothetical protein